MRRTLVSAAVIAGAFVGCSTRVVVGHERAPTTVTGSNDAGMESDGPSERDDDDVQVEDDGENVGEQLEDGEQDDDVSNQDD